MTRRLVLSRHIGTLSVVLLGGCAGDSPGSSPFELSGTSEGSSSTTSAGSTTALDVTGAPTTGSSAVDLTTAVVECGNGVAEPGEECDDGDNDDADACVSSCVAARCGDGAVWAGVEECDDGNLDADDECLPTCAAAVCGDGVVHAGVEECDDANSSETDACRGTCVLAHCGDGIVQDGVEECDDAGETETCDADCTKPMCGDGEVNKTAGEECDDGNDVYADNCYPTCVAPSMLIFLTSERYHGGLGGVAGADKKCQTLAKQAGLAGTYKAWLWSSNSGPELTFYHSPGKYLRPDLVKVANNFEHLLHGPLMAPIIVTEKKEKFPDPTTGIWTGWYPYSDGPLPDYWDEYTCEDWTADSWDYGGGATFADWYFLGHNKGYVGLNCHGEEFPLICVQQAWIPP